MDFLDKENIELGKEFDDLNADYELKRFLKKGLTIIELNKIRAIVSEYNLNKSKIEYRLFKKSKEFKSITNEKKLLLEEKRKLYGGLIPYINPDFKKQYLGYIKEDAKIFNEQKKISSDLIAKKEILNTKVETIETKIQQHKDFINENIKKIIESKLDEKIKNLDNNESFKVLNRKSKVKVLEKSIRKIKIKLENIEDNNYAFNTGSLITTSINNFDNKIQTFNIAIKKLEDFKNSIK